MVGLAIFCTFIAGAIGAFLEPTSFAVSVPIAVMGAFILKEIRDVKATIIQAEIEKAEKEAVIKQAAEEQRQKEEAEEQRRIEEEMIALVVASEIADKDKRT